MTRRAYGCRLNRSAARHPSEILTEDIRSAMLTAEIVSERSGIPLYVLRELLTSRRLPTPKESEAIAPLLGREKRYYHKRAMDWRDENS